ncbi:hypothetical protein DIC82_00635 [Clostridium beijerinckii]|nr:hypothetical protein DIC82_00635 [Clostridium beijerinckii]
MKNCMSNLKLNLKDKKKVNVGA